MSSETLQTISQVVIAAGILLTALGGFGAYVFSQRVEHGKEERTAFAGKLEAKRKTIFSPKEGVIPSIEFGDSGAILYYLGSQEVPILKFAENTDLSIASEDGQVKVSTTIRDKSGRIVAELRRNDWKVNPSQSWDRNYSADALEVRDPTGDVVLQVRALPDRIQFQAKLYDSSGRGLGFGKMMGPQGQGGGLEFTGPENPDLTMKIEPMFEYPSDSHLGEFRKKR